MKQISFSLCLFSVLFGGSATKADATHSTLTAIHLRARLQVEVETAPMGAPVRFFLHFTPLGMSIR